MRVRLQEQVAHRRLHERPVALRGRDDAGRRGGGATPQEEGLPRWSPWGGGGGDSTREVTPWLHEDIPARGARW